MNKNLDMNKYIPSYKDDILIFLILDMHVRNKKSGIASLYLA